MSSFEHANCSRTNKAEPLTGCNSEQAAARVLGFTQVSWDNLSGQEKQPISFDKNWMALTQHEQAAAIALGYTKTTWDNMSGSEAQPASVDKAWSELTSCGAICSVCAFVWYSGTSSVCRMMSLCHMTVDYCARVVVCIFFVVVIAIN